MAVYGYTLREAREQLEVWKACLKALGEGQAQHYKVGSREFTALDLDEVQRMVRYFENMVEALSGQARTSRVVRVVARDV